MNVIWGEFALEVFGNIVYIYVVSDFAIWENAKLL